MQLIQRTWQTFVYHQDVRTEGPITTLFREALIEAYEKAGRRWFIALEDPVTNSTTGQEIGRNDLNFFPPEHHRQTVFFTVECKCLHVKTPSGLDYKADDYVNKGLKRFMEQNEGVYKYSNGLPCGGMLGYVMDNQLDEAFGRVQSQIKAKSVSLKMKKLTSMHVPSTVLPTCNHSADTIHQRTDGDFIVHHLLVKTPHSATSC